MISRNRGAGPTGILNWLKPNQFIKIQIREWGQLYYRYENLIGERASRILPKEEPEFLIREIIAALNNSGKIQSLWFQENVQGRWPSYLCFLMLQGPRSPEYFRCQTLRARVRHSSFKSTDQTRTVDLVELGCWIIPQDSSLLQKVNEQWQQKNSWTMEATLLVFSRVISINAFRVYLSRLLDGQHQTLPTEKSSELNCFEPLSNKENHQSTEPNAAHVDQKKSLPSQ